MVNRRALMVRSALALALSVAVIAGCTGGPPKGPASPGVKSAALKGMEVVGYLAKLDGVWTVLESDPGESDESEALATLIPGSVDEGGIKALEGRYIWAAGRSSDDEADTPQIKVDGIDVAVEPATVN